MDQCPKCRFLSLREKGLHEGGGVVCTTTDCDYWECY